MVLLTIDGMATQNHVTKHKRSARKLNIHTRHICHRPASIFQAAMELYTGHYLREHNPMAPFMNDHSIYKDYYEEPAAQYRKPEIYWDSDKGVYYEQDRYGNAIDYERLCPTNFDTYEDYLHAFEYFRNPQSPTAYAPPKAPRPIYNVNRGDHYDRTLVDTAIIGDSIIRKVGKIGHCHVICYPGLKVDELTHLIEENKCPELAGKNHIVIHVGTNSLDIPYQRPMLSFTNLFVSIRHNYPRANIIWNCILPRGDVCEAKAYKIIMLNREQRSNRQQVSVISCVGKFHKNRNPKLEMFKSDKLHLNAFGVLTLRNTIRHDLLRWRSRMGITTLSAIEAPYEPTSVLDNWRALV